jgi:membrane-bound lytic murein transglycosylase MltF
MRGVLAMVIATGVLTACSRSPEPAATNATPGSPPPIDIPQAPDQPISDREKLTDTAKIDLDAIAERGYLRILIAPSRTHFETVDSRHHGRGVDAGIALTRAIGEQTAKDVKAVFIATREDRLVADLLAGKGDVAANVLLTFARDEQVAFAPPIKTGIREVVVTGAGRPLVSLEDVGGRTIHVRKDSDHHASLFRLNEQLAKINRPGAKIVVEAGLPTDEDLLDAVNSGRVPAAIVDDYIFEMWRQDFPNIAANRDIAVSQDGSLSWVTRKDALKLTALVKEFFSTHTLRLWH